MYVNPFRSDDALETLSFPGREKEHKALSAALVSGRHLAFTAPRGFGAVRVVEKNRRRPQTARRHGACAKSGEHTDICSTHRAGRTAKC